jgi:hypothetical protein
MGKTWSLTLREQHAMLVLRIFAGKRDVVVRSWRKPHNENLCMLCSSEIRMIKMR